jgi:hypothetical protein
VNLTDKVNAKAPAGGLHVKPNIDVRGTAFPQVIQSFKGCCVGDEQVGVKAVRNNRPILQRVLEKKSKTIV